MSNNITEVVFILDASGSMHSLTDDTIGGFNSMLGEQKGKEGQVYVSTVSFNDKSRVIHDRLPIEEVAEITKEEYRAAGSTALMDAMGDAIHHIGNIHKYIRKEDIPEHTLFVITTDGMENSSHKYSSDEVKKMVEAKKELGWEFIFMGANIDAVETAEEFGIDEDRAVTYKSDSIGTGLNFKVMSKVVGNIRSAGCISEEWAEPIKNRKDRGDEHK